MRSLARGARLVVFPSAPARSRSVHGSVAVLPMYPTRRPEGWRRAGERLTRVAYLTPLYFNQTSYLGGGERYPLNLAKAVVATGGYEVDLVSYGDEPRQQTLTIAPGVTLRALPSTGSRGRHERLSWDI